MSEIASQRLLYYATAAGLGVTIGAFAAWHFSIKRLQKGLQNALNEQRILEDHLENEKHNREVCERILQEKAHPSSTPFGYLLVQIDVKQDQIPTMEEYKKRFSKHSKTIWRDPESEGP